jgi:hypothetical protein
LLHKALATLAVATCFLYFGPSASAANAPETGTITVSEDAQQTLWSQASLSPRSSSKAQIRILAPVGSAHAHRLWQRCTFRVSTVGTYRCGIDVSDGSIAGASSGIWKIELVVDGAKLDATKLSL